MKRGILLTLVAAVFLISAIGGAITFHQMSQGRQSPRVADMLGVPSLAHQIHLYGGTAAPGKPVRPEDVSQDYFAGPDFDRLALSHIVTKSGTTEDDEYYPGTDRIKMYSQDYYRAVGDEMVPHLRGAAMYEHDGVTYKKHVVRRPNGSIERIGQRLRDGRYEMRYMFDDPDHLDRTTVWRLRYFDSGLNFVSETIYDWTKDHRGTFVSAKIFQADFVGQYYVSIYREDGTLVATMKHSPGTDTGTLFDTDGTTVVADWGKDMSSAAFYNLYQRGSDLPVQVWESLMGRMRVTVLEPETHNIVYQQLWKERPDPNNPGGKIYLLIRVGTAFQGSSPKLRVEMAGNGSHPTELITADSAGDQTVHKLDQDDKKVVRVASAPAGSPLVSVSQSGDEEVVQIDEALLKIPARPRIPAFDDFGPQRLYDYP